MRLYLLAPLRLCLAVALVQITLACSLARLSRPSPLAPSSPGRLLAVLRHLMNALILGGDLGVGPPAHVIPYLYPSSSLWHKETPSRFLTLRGMCQ